MAPSTQTNRQSARTLGAHSLAVTKRRHPGTQPQRKAEQHSDADAVEVSNVPARAGNLALPVHGPRSDAETAPADPETAPLRLIAKEPSQKGERSWRTGLQCRTSYRYFFSSVQPAAPAVHKPAAMAIARGPAARA